MVRHYLPPLELPDRTRRHIGAVYTPIAESPQPPFPTGHDERDLLAALWCREHRGYDDVVSMENAETKLRRVGAIPGPTPKETP
jgi:hypothetical protein